MKLLIKSTDKKTKIDFNGDSKLIMCAMLGAIHAITRGVAKNEAGFEDAKKIIIAGTQALNYDGTTNNELFNKLMSEHGA